MPPNKGSMKQRTLQLMSKPKATTQGVKSARKQLKQRQGIGPVKTSTAQGIGVRTVKHTFKAVKQANKLKLKIKQTKRIGTGASKGKKSNNNGSAPQAAEGAVVVKKLRGKAAQNAKLAKCDMHVNLKIPVAICKNLPSVKTNLKSDMKKSHKSVIPGEVRGAGVYKRHSIDLTESTEGADENGQAAKTLLGAKKRRGEVIKYQLHLQKEEKFNGMIFDIAMGQSGDIVVTCTEEAVLCDANLKRKRRLDRVMSPGGAGFFRSTGDILVVCRCSDNVNVFTASGTYKRSFPCGPSPCGLTVTTRDEIVVTDTGAKLVRFYASDGSLLRTIHPTGDNYLLRWPIYATSHEDAVVVSDCHQQRVLVFSHGGAFRQHFPLRTQAGNQVLRPHGVCANAEGDLFIIDSAIDSMEVFQGDGTFRQTLLPSDDGVLLKPKVIAINPSNTLLALGGMRGAVRLYRFIRVTETIATPANGADPPLSKVSSRREQRREVKREVKVEVKTEVKDDVIVLD